MEEPSQPPRDSPQPEPALAEAQKWIEWGRFAIGLRGLKLPASAVSALLVQSCNRKPGAKGSQGWRGLQRPVKPVAHLTGRGCEEDASLSTSSVTLPRPR
uniref:Uncharacterized protein n=1 Tax=Sphaerodactylus townsendi TaxID=933632 RepID=A0ACB8E7E0_9SAUR